jgi:hypothetical protein
MIKSDMKQCTDFSEEKFKELNSNFKNLQQVVNQVKNTSSALAKIVHKDAFDEMTREIDETDQMVQAFLLSRAHSDDIKKCIEDLKDTKYDFAKKLDSLKFLKDMLFVLNESCYGDAFRKSYFRFQFQKIEEALESFEKDIKNQAAQTIVPKLKEIIGFYDELAAIQKTEDLGMTSEKIEEYTDSIKKHIVQVHVSLCQNTLKGGRKPKEQPGEMIEALKKVIIYSHKVSKDLVEDQKACSDILNSCMGEINFIIKNHLSGDRIALVERWSKEIKELAKQLKYEELDELEARLSLTISKERASIPEQKEKCATELKNRKSELEALNKKAAGVESERDVNVALKEEMKNMAGVQNRSLREQTTLDASTEEIKGMDSKVQMAATALVAKQTDFSEAMVRSMGKEQTLKSYYTLLESIAKRAEGSRLKKKYDELAKDEKRPAPAALLSKTFSIERNFKRYLTGKEEESKQILEEFLKSNPESTYCKAIQGHLQNPHEKHEKILENLIKRVEENFRDIPVPLASFRTLHKARILGVEEGVPKEKIWRGEGVPNEKVLREQLEIRIERLKAGPESTTKGSPAEWGGVWGTGAKLFKGTKQFLEQAADVVADFVVEDKKDFSTYKDKIVELSSNYKGEEGKRLADEASAIVEVLEFLNKESVSQVLRCSQLVAYQRAVQAQKDIDEADTEIVNIHIAQEAIKAKIKELDQMPKILDEKDQFLEQLLESAVQVDAVVKTFSEQST